VAQARRPAGVSPSPPTIRTGTIDDVDAVLAFWIRAGAHPSATDTVPDLARVRLAGAAEDWLRNEGAVRLSALVEGDSEIAPVFWESVGFEHYQGMRRYSKNL
jgi:hypothetical protein